MSLSCDWHAPPYSKGSHDSDSETELKEIRQYANPILESYGVDLVLSGHSHAYERSYLLDGHYGDSSTLTSSMIKDSGDGREDGSGAYEKPVAQTAHKGVVYTVAGSSGQTSGGSLNHPAMYISLNVLGSLVLDVNGSRLDAKFLNSSGSAQDHFTIKKDLGTSTFDFSLTNGGSKSVTQGASVSNSISATLVSGTAQSVAFSASGVPTGATVAFSPTACTPTCSTGLSLSTSPSTPTGTYTLTVTGTGGGVTKTTSFSLTVTAAGPTTATTVSFQDGVWPTSVYAGTRDTYLDRSAPSMNYGNSTTVWVDGDDGKSALLRWKSFTLPAGSTVKSATITLTVTDSTSGTYNLYALKRDWWQDYASWTSYGPGYSWEVPGAQGTSDREATVVGTVTAPSTGPVTITLNAAGIALVQSWVDSPSTNNGIIIDNPTVTDGLAFASREASTASNRPKLTVTYGAP